MHARVLGYLILHAPNHTAEAENAKSIVSCAGNREKLDELGESFVKWFINICKHDTTIVRRSKGRTPTPSHPPSRPSFDREREVMASTHFNVGVDEQGEPTDKVHFILVSLLPSPSLCLSEQACSIDLSVLKRFGYPVETLNGVGVHSLVNIMTLQADVHDLFDRLQLWLEATEIPHRYRIQSSRRIGAIVRRREFVTFTTSDPHRFPLPSPELLALHAACAKVANLSGAAEFLDKVDRDLEELDVLKANGDSSEVLDVAIWRLAHAM
ncbi:hypothetical protein PC9H_011298 [Pleurotus ostreatus]|uniref:HNH nuclease domain-containing protein n=1 Tax=Pleurotus ostreatus TaxID=5322 RepID=A0A8H6ZL77_PLEOS|nr:uncharacterized protein PC9H_011298 [Pleurotus ostreatus]KAF7420780.1 hypothetical protein PC9H_011298 [Pleurotus ostreatus]KAJ8690183.1 hypothetical protein PTI98_011637 [Pleurotus ostreatus]